MSMKLTKVESERVLRVYIDCHLTWNENIDILRGPETASKNYYFSKSSEISSSKYRLLFYNASFKPLFTCFWILFGATVAKQKRCGRLILNSLRDARSFDNFQKLKWMPMDQMFKINKRVGLWRKLLMEEIWNSLLLAWTTFVLSTIIPQELQHHTIYQNQEPKQRGEHPSIPPT